MRVIGFVSAAFIAAAAVGMSSDAAAQRNRGQQGGGVVVINFQRVIADSVAGRDMTAKLQQVQAQVGAEAQALAPEQQSLQQESQRLTRARGNRTDEQIRADATLAPQFQQYFQRRQQLEVRAATLQGDIECSQAVALREFTNNMVMPVVQSVMRTRGAGTVVGSGSTFYVAPESDITQTVIDQLNQNPATRTVNVTRHPVAECLAQQQPAAPAPSPQQ